MNNTIPNHLQTMCCHLCLLHYTCYRSKIFFAYANISFTVKEYHLIKPISYA